VNKFKLLVLGLAIAALGNSQANAAILTFDDITTDPTASITNYGGFTWTSTGVLNSTTYALPSGYKVANTSGDYVAFNEFAGIASANSTTFDFIGANLTSAWNDDLQLEVKGLLGGSELYSQTVTLQSVAPDAAKRFDFNFTGIDELVFTSSGGTHNQDDFGDLDPSAGIGGTHFAMDDFEYQTGDVPAPEPTSMALGFLGLSGILGLRRRK